MIMTVDELKKYINTNENEEMLKTKILTMEYFVRAYTNNCFYKIGARKSANIVESEVLLQSKMNLKEGDTVRISASVANDGIYTVAEVNNESFKVEEALEDEDYVIVNKIEYPISIKLGVAKLIEWEEKNMDKIGISSETISRHSVTYADPNGEQYVCGYPKALMAFLKPYRKARF